MLVMLTFSSPHWLANGASDITRPTVVQLGLVTMVPFHLRCFCCSRISARWSGLTSGISRGTSCSMRKFDELETTMWPAWANSCSTWPATLESREENSSCGAPPGLHSCTGNSQALLGMGSRNRQVQASRYVLPADRSEAASHLTSNQ